MDRLEEKLSAIATYHNDEDLARLAMRMLRNHFSWEYHWCLDYDGLAAKIEAGCLCWKQ